MEEVEEEPVITYSVAQLAIQVWTQVSPDKNDSNSIGLRFHIEVIVVHVKSQNIERWLKQNRQQKYVCVRSNSTLIISYQYQ